jgi:hypothetical protein
MKKAKSNNNSISKGPVVLKVDKRLDSYLEKDLFKEKLDKVNEILRTTKLPKFDK